MSAQAIAYALISAAAGVTAIAGARVYPAMLPEGVGLPAAVVRLVSNTRVGAIDAAATQHLYRARVQVNALAADFVQAQSLRQAVKAAMKFQRGAIGGVTVSSIVDDVDLSDDYDPELHAHVAPADFIIVWTSST
jgi:hypothetical protein